MNTRLFSIGLLTFLLLIQTILVLPAYAFSVTESSIAPSSFSPDGNGLNDTTTITIVLDNSVTTLYANIFNQSSEALVANHRIMTEGPAKTYKYTWNGKDDSSSVVPQGIYTVRVSENPSQYGDTIGTVYVDLTPPGSPSLTVNGGAAYTLSRNVNLTISATGASQMKISNSADFTGATWETYATTRQWTLKTSDGTKTVYIDFRNIAGASVTTSATITLDTTINDPILSINNGANSTNNRTVTLTITANDATYMKIDNNTRFANMTSWIPKTNTSSFRLPGGQDGTRTVCLRVKDNAGNTKTTSASISLDTTSPSNLSLSINSGATYTNRTSVTLTLSASGGPSRVYLSNTSSTWRGYDYTSSLPWTLLPGDGQKTVYFKAADGEGNNATAITQTITLDTTAPTSVTLNTPTDGQTVTTQRPTFSWSDPNSDTQQYYLQIIQSGSTVQSGYRETTSYTATTLAPGSYSWRVTVYDRAGNYATTSQRSFTISVTGLAIPSPTYPANNSYYNNTDIAVILRWTAVTDATYYDVQFGRTSGDLNYTGTSTQYGTSYTITTPELRDTNVTYWRVRSRNATTSSDYSDVFHFTIDTQAPSGVTLLINDNASYTTSPSVTLTLGATGAAWMKISNYANFSGADWESFATTKSWDLASIEGTRTVYLKVKDNATGDQGSTSYANVAATITDTIILDTTAPSISSPSPESNGTSTTTTNLAIRATLSDNGTGVNTSAVTLQLDSTQIPYANLTVTSVLVRYTAPTIATGTHTVRITTKDYADHTGYYNWSFTVETEQQGGTPPPGGETVPAISDITRSPTTVTSLDVVTVSANVTAATAITSVDLFWNDGTLRSKPMGLLSGHLYRATIGPFTAGTHVTYYIVALDVQSLEKQSATYNFTVKDATAPTIIVVSPTEGTIITERTPKIEATYSDSGGINTSTVRLSFDGTDVTTYATITATKITFVPATPLSYKDYTVTLEVSDQAGNKATKTWSFTVIADEHNFTKTITNITAGETKTIDFNDSGTALEKIEVTAANKIESLTVHCSITGIVPEGVAVPKNSVYLYLVIDTNVETNAVSSAVITFKVEQKWLTDNKIDKSAVKLLRYTNGWNELTLTISSEDATYVHYRATTPGFSVFAITGAAQPTGGISLLLIAVIIILVAIIALGILLYYRRYI
jgi:PGF-pre-PGF domain-containing protein